MFVDRARVKVAGRTVRAGQVIEVNDRRRARRADEARPAARARDRVPRRPPRSSRSTSPRAWSPRRRPRAIAATCSISSAGQFGEVYLVHRLDLPTSGLLVFARTRDANKRLGDAFKVHDVDREYRAVVIGEVAAQTIDRPIDGQRAVTHVGAARGARGRDAGRGAARDRAHPPDPRSPRGPRPPGRSAITSTAARPAARSCPARRGSRSTPRSSGFAHPATGERVRFESRDPRRARALDRAAPRALMARRQPTESNVQALTTAARPASSSNTPVIAGTLRERVPRVERRRGDHDREIPAGRGVVRGEPDHDVGARRQQLRAQHLGELRPGPDLVVEQLHEAEPLDHPASPTPTAPGSASR